MAVQRRPLMGATLAGQIARWQALRCLALLCLVGGTWSGGQGGRVVMAEPPESPRQSTAARAAPAGARPDAAADVAGDAARGYHWLTEKPYLPSDLDDEIFDQLWRTWEGDWRERAERADPLGRRELAFSYYGLTRRPGDDSGRPLQYVVNERGQWVSNCFSCHGGKVAGRVIPGLPNSMYALQTLTEDVIKTKARLGKPLGTMDLGSLFFPLGSTRGTTNAVMFGVVLLAKRDADLNFRPNNPLPRLTHHDMDPPPWWHFHKRPRLYVDGLAEKGHRPLMQFMLVKENGPEQFREWESDFRDVYAYLDSLRAPAYPFPIDRQLADRGRVIFEDHCSRCHGTYGEREEYPGVLVPWDEVRTDRVRLDSLDAAHRQRYAESWFADYGRKRTELDPGGYVAPPLDGIWASAPYLHNGSVPTLWHLFHPDQRPTVWKRSEDGYDTQRVGLEVETFEEVPLADRGRGARRWYFDTTQPGKSAAGHTFPAQLDEGQKRALLEYLKTL